MNCSFAPQGVAPAHRCEAKQIVKMCMKTAGLRPCTISLLGRRLGSLEDPEAETPIAQVRRWTHICSRLSPQACERGAGPRAGFTAQCGTRCAGAGRRRTTCSSGWPLIGSGPGGGGRHHGHIA